MISKESFAVQHRQVEAIILYPDRLGYTQLAAPEVGPKPRPATTTTKAPWEGIPQDYPHAGELMANGTIDLSAAYPERIGEWDKVAINYGYVCSLAETSPTRTVSWMDAWQGSPLHD